MQKKLQIYKVAGKDKLSHIYMDDIKEFAKNEKELETLIQTTRIYSQDIGMGFEIKKCVLFKIKMR